MPQVPVHPCTALYGCFLSPPKSWHICKDVDEARAQEAFAQRSLLIQVTCGQMYLSGFMGSAETKTTWLDDKVAVWTAVVDALSRITNKWPQTTYAGFTFCLQNEWQYIQRVVADIGSYFAPLEWMIWTKFLTSLISIPS